MFFFPLILGQSDVSILHNNAEYFTPVLLELHDLLVSISELALFNNIIISYQYSFVLLPVHNRNPLEPFYYDQDHQVLVSRLVVNDAWHRRDCPPPHPQELWESPDPVFWRSDCTLTGYLMTAGKSLLPLSFISERVIPCYTFSFHKARVRFVMGFFP